MSLFKHFGPNYKRIKQWILTVIKERLQVVTHTYIHVSRVVLFSDKTATLFEQMILSLLTGMPAAVAD